MGELQCQVCRRRVEVSRLTRRDLSRFYSMIASVADSLEDVNMWLCCFCWKRVSQCTHFIMTMQQSLNLLSEKTNCASTNLYSFANHRLPNITICKMAGCTKIIDEEDKSSEPLTQIKQEFVDMEIKTEIKCENEVEAEFVDTGNFKAFASPELQNSDEDDSDGINLDSEKGSRTSGKDQDPQEGSRTVSKNLNSEEGARSLPQIHWSDLGSAKEENVKHLGVQLLHFTEQQVIEEIKKRKESARYKYAKYRCEDCAYFNAKEEYFTKHINMKHSQVECKHECNMCHYRFLTSSELEEHRSQHLRRWRCVRCDVDLRQDTWYKHGANCLPTAQSKCDVCNKIFPNKYLLRRHHVFAHVNMKTKQYECTLCKRKYKHESQLEIHARTHTGENPFECNQCDMKFVSKNNMLLHIRQMHVEHPMEKVYCVQCDRYFRSPEELDKHVTNTVTHAGQTKYKFECNTCHKKFTNQTLLNAHVRIQHIGTKDYNCPICNKAFGVERYMKRHMARHSHRKAPRDHVCDLCGAALTSKKFLKDHMTAIHYKLKPYKCDVCDATFGYKSTMYMHKKLKHEGKKKGKKSSTVNSLA